MFRVRGLLLAVFLGVVFPAAASDAEQEIAGLIDAIGQAHCSFERNGRWYDADTARSHLQRKYEWLRKRALASTAEQFIERAASRSSASGTVYRVRCGDAKAVESSQWFGQRLQQLRANESSHRTR